jgi:hypothetical protein
VVQFHPTVPSKIKYLSRFFGHLASQISRYGKRMGSQGSTVNEPRAMERLCLEQAALCVLQESREALEQIALNYRTAREQQAGRDCAGAVLIRTRATAD